MDQYGWELNLLTTLHPDTVKSNRSLLNPEGTATDRNVMYDGNMPSNKTTLKMNLKKNQANIWKDIRRDMHPHTTLWRQSGAWHMWINIFLILTLDKDTYKFHTLSFYVS